MTIPGPKILNLGDPGTGKTYCLRTLLKCGVTPFVIFTERSESTLSNVAGVKWHTVSPRGGGISGMVDYARKIASLSMEALSKYTPPKADLQFVEVLETLANFKDDRTGEEFGKVDTWGPERCIVIDSLSGINKMVLDIVTGSRATRTLPEWNVSQDQEQRFLDTLVSMPCSVIVNAHLEPERDEVSGAVRIYASALGRKLSPSLPRMFDEIMHSTRTGTNFRWDTASDQVSTKVRMLPMRKDLPQDYSLVFDEWVRAGGVLPPKTQAAA